MASFFTQVRKHNKALWQRWYKMTQRCEQNWEYYEDVSICDDWNRDVVGPEQAFLNFWEDMGDDFDESLTLDRIDPNGNYEPHNCRWATVKTQNNNHRFHHTDRGRWLLKAKEKWGNGQTTRIRFWRRVKKGWSFEDAAMTPPKNRGPGAKKRRK